MNDNTCPSCGKTTVMENASNATTIYPIYHTGQTTAEFGPSTKPINYSHQTAFFIALSVILGVILGTLLVWLIFF